MHRVRLLFSLPLVFSALILLTLSAACRADIDFNNDGNPDLLFQNATSGLPVYWTMTSVNNTGGASMQLPGANYKIIDSADFNGDGVSDLVFQNSVTNQIAFWVMNGPTPTQGFALSQVPEAGFNLVGSGDFNGDGKPDLLFQNQTTGQLVVWYLNGTSYAGGVAFNTVPSANFRVVGIGDFNGDGKPDIVFQNTVTNQIAFWLLDGITVTGGGGLSNIPQSPYKVVGLSDFNGDNKPDLLFQNQTTGQLVYWLIDGMSYAGGATLKSPDAGFNIAGIRTFYPRPVVTQLNPLSNTALYGTVRLRVRNLINPKATVAVKVGAVASPSATLTFPDRTAPDTGIGGAIDFQVPRGLAAGAQNITVTVGGRYTATWSVHVTDTNPFAVFNIQKGATGAKSTFVAELRADASPNTVANFVGLATGTKTWDDPCNNNAATNTPLYNGTTFHRVVAGFVEQGGDPLSRCLAPGNSNIGSGNPGFTIPLEKNSLTHVDGAMAMARSTGINTAGSQFFIDNGPQPDLNETFDGSGNPNGGYCVFGLVVEGLAATKALTVTYEPDGATPIPGAIPDTMVSVIITGKIDTP